MESAGYRIVRWSQAPTYRVLWDNDSRYLVNSNIWGIQIFSFKRYSRIYEYLEQLI
jgi:hypothetical protein